MDKPKQTKIKTKTNKRNKNKQKIKTKQTVTGKTSRMSCVKDALSEMTVVQLRKLAVELHLVGYVKTLNKKDIIALFVNQSELWPFIGMEYVLSSSSGTSIGSSSFSSPFSVHAQERLVPRLRVLLFLFNITYTFYRESIKTFLRSKCIKEIRTIAVELNLEGFNENLNKDEVITLFERNPSLWPLVRRGRVASLCQLSCFSECDYEITAAASTKR